MVNFFPNNSFAEEFIRMNTQDFWMLFIDQSKAKYKLLDVFKKMKAEPEVPPFRIGDEEFWKEHQGNWEQQLKKFANIKSHTLEEFQERARRQFKNPEKKKR